MTHSEYLNGTASAAYAQQQNAMNQKGYVIFGGTHGVRVAPAPSQIAAEAHQGLVLDGVAKRISK